MPFCFMKKKDHFNQKVLLSHQFTFKSSMMYAQEKACSEPRRASEMKLVLQK